ncbi:MAG: hypothetical protein IJP17_07455, partial [Clostridia bacterium]|nr:hypothetical protein [Clostridia bacterium]
MKTMSLQFHATTQDIYEFIIKVLKNNNYKICGVKYLPQFTVETELDVILTLDLKRYDCIVISNRAISCANNTYEFMKLQNNNLVIDIGTDDNRILKESAISVFSEQEIDPDWKKIINAYKKCLLKGAWVVNP